MPGMTCPHPGGIRTGTVAQLFADIAAFPVIPGIGIVGIVTEHLLNGLAALGHILTTDQRAGAVKSLARSLNRAAFLAGIEALDLDIFDYVEHGVHIVFDGLDVGVLIIADGNTRNRRQYRQSIDRG